MAAMKRFHLKRLGLTFVAATAVVLQGWVIPAQATPITYTATATLSGKIGNTAFTNAAVTVTLKGDTANVAVPPSPLPSTSLVTVGTATIDIAGVGTATFTDPVEVFSSYNTTTPVGPFPSQS
jgi:hypothetical protein